MSHTPEPVRSAAEVPPGMVAAVRDACLRILLDAYEDAGMQGLCGEGRWEVAVQELRRADPDAIARAAAGGGSDDPAPRPGGSGT